MQPLPGELSTCAMRDERGENNIFKNCPQTKLEYLSSTRSRCFVLKATMSSFLSTICPKVPRKKKSHFLITGSLATLDVSSYVQSCNMGFVAEKKKKTWQNKGSIFEPSQTQHWQSNLNFSQSDQLAKETIMHTVNCTKVPRRERKGCQKNLSKNECMV